MTMAKDMNKGGKLTATGQPPMKQVLASKMTVKKSPMPKASGKKK
jgi:hypothetical protein